MDSFLKKAVNSVQSLLIEGYYNVKCTIERKNYSLRDYLNLEKIKIIAELKKASPTYGIIKSNLDYKLPFELLDNGAVGLSFLIERNYFQGSIDYLADISPKIKAPLIFKDFIIHKKQIDAAKNVGADIVLLIAEIFEDNLSYYSLKELIDYSHRLNLETIVETSRAEIVNKLMETEADYIGINNRNLKTLEIDHDRFYKISSKINKKKPLIAESGYSDKNIIIRDMKAGADFFLIGTSIISAQNPVAKLKELMGND